MRVLVAPQEFKGTLSARDAAEAIARGLRRALLDAEIDLVPLADGGPGTVEALAGATSGSYHETEVQGPLGRAVRARWGALGDGETAVIEMAAASGLTLIRPAERDPWRASTYGTGELIRAALGGGHGRIIVGAGGSATNDGGAGMAQALGARLLDRAGNELLPGGGALARLERVDVGELDVRLRAADVVVATDVTNPLCGADGASLVYGAQKGATPDIARALDEALAHYARVLANDLGADVADVPGAGAAGGLAAGLIAFGGAQVRAGFDVVAEAAGLDERIRRADAVITGEGRIDRQTPFGKTTAGVARMARAARRPVFALAGSVERGSESDAAQEFDDVLALVPGVATEQQAQRRAGRLLERLAEELGRRLAGRS